MHDCALQDCSYHFRCAANHGVYLRAHTLEATPVSAELQDLIDQTWHVVLDGDVQGLRRLLEHSLVQQLPDCEPPQEQEEASSDESDEYSPNPDDLVSPDRTTQQRLAAGPQQNIWKCNTAFGVPQRDLCVCS